MKLFRKSIFILSLLAFLSCSDDDKLNLPKTDSPESVLSEMSVIDTITVDQIKMYYTQYLTIMNQGFGVEVDIESELAKIKYDVAYTAVQYESVDPFGKTRLVSGLVGYPILPLTQDYKVLKIASLQHGTLTYPEQAPSKTNFDNINNIRDILTLVVPSFEKGYVIVLPDYFGYGVDQNNLHYYEHRQSLSSTSRGLIEGISDYAKDKSLTIDFSKLYLLGYSEGGFATMSTLKSFSETDSKFQDFVTVAGAGAYDKVTTATNIVQQEEGEDARFVASYSWVLLTYNHVYGINRPLNELFTEEVVPELSKYVANNNIMLAEDLPSSPNQVFSQTFAQGLANKTDRLFMNALNDNTITDFTPKGSVALVHGDADGWVPPFNTDVIYDNFKKKGVTITKTIVPGGTHASSYAVFALEALNRMK